MRTYHFQVTGGILFEHCDDGHSEEIDSRRRHHIHGLSDRNQKWLRNQLIHSVETYISSTRQHAFNSMDIRILKVMYCGYCGCAWYHVHSRYAVSAIAADSNQLTKLLISVK